MVRRVQVDGVPVAKAAARVRVLPPELLCERLRRWMRAGRRRLCRAGRGRGGPHKLTEEVLEFAEVLLAADSSLACRQLVERHSSGSGYGCIHARSSGHWSGAASRGPKRNPIASEAAAEPAGPGNWPGGTSRCGPRCSADPMTAEARLGGARPQGHGRLASRAGAGSDHAASLLAGPARRRSGRRPGGRGTGAGPGRDGPGRCAEAHETADSRRRERVTATGSGREQGQCRASSPGRLPVCPAVHAAQVLTNTESTQRQYALRRRAVALGWASDQVMVIDTDQGQSGASASRPGRLPAPGRRGRHGPRRDRARPGGVPAGPQQRRLAPAAGDLRAGRHADLRRGRPLRPGRLQRPARCSA